jgi:hypothetical protein
MFFRDNLQCVNTPGQYGNVQLDLLRTGLMDCSKIPEALKRLICLRGSLSVDLILTLSRAGFGNRVKCPFSAAISAHHMDQVPVPV